ncbi:MAG: DEAD/DEAH box helicase family protein [Bacteroidetes bacterium]|nr:DEAD/DEAH box helicase family protein [Bacteroidota bacterium]
MQAYQDWVANRRTGIFAMATGTGKTITALNCLLEEYRLSGTFSP